MGRIVCSVCSQPARDGIPLRHENGVATCAKCKPEHPAGPARATMPDVEIYTPERKAEFLRNNAVDAEDAKAAEEPKPHWWEKRSS